jgi:hypothetical protein
MKPFLNITFAVELFVLICLATVAVKAEPNNKENVNKFCAYVVGIPYASDNFTDEEWVRFQYCRDTLNQ